MTLLRYTALMIAGLLLVGLLWFLWFNMLAYFIEHTVAYRHGQPTHFRIEDAPVRNEGNRFEGHDDDGVFP